MSLYRSLYIGLVILLSCNIQTMISAQVVADSVRSLDECVVTSTMAPRTLKSIPIMTQLITKQDIARLNPRSANDILQMAIPGIEINQHGAQTRLRVQGMSGEHVLFMIDGEPINSEGNGSVDLNRIDIANIERIEIVRGSASAIYGSNAIGGVINFITRKVHQPLMASLTADYGTEGAWRTHALVGFTRGALSSQTTASYNHQEAYSLLSDTEDPFLVRGSNTWILGERLRYQSPNRQWELTTNLSGSRRTLNWDDKIKYLYDSHDLGGRISYAPGPRHSTFVSYNTSAYKRTQYFFTAQDNQHLKLFDLHTHRARGQYNFGQEGRDIILLNAGFDAVWERVGGDRIQSEGKHFASHTVALYSQAEWRALPYLSASLGFRQDMHSNFGRHFSPRLTLLFKQKHWRIRLSYSEGFRSPSTKELYMDWDHRGIFRLKGNPRLRPETSRMLSIAPEIRLCKDINLTLQTSYNRIYNRIYNQEEEGGLVRRFRNAEADSEVWQAQMSLRWQISPAIRLNADYAYVRDQISVYSKTQGQLPGSTVRPHSMNCSMTYSKGWRSWVWNTDASLRWASAISTAVYSEALADYHLQRYDAFGILRVGTSLTYKGSKATLGVDNILNYQPNQVNISSSLSPGRTLFASLTLSL
ncbi:MAG: TonB-dependent receptor [Porphyromonadaceae bacterium]|nr:TonB-dependent receptor [Porphyromonadaceae bacterium]